MRKDWRIALAVAGALAAASCDTLFKAAEDPAPAVPSYAANVVVVDREIAANARWLEGKVYCVTDYVRVKNGSTLTVEPGAVVKFAAAAVLDAEAGSTIKAAGTAAKPIVFTSIRDASAGGDSVLDDGTAPAAAGDWHGVAVEAGSVGNEFRYCDFRFGGKDSVAVLAVMGSAVVAANSFRDNLGGHPIDSNAGSATLDASEAQAGTLIRDNVFYRNRWPLAIARILDLDASNSFSFDEDGDPATPPARNVHQAVHVNYGDIAGNVSWTETEVPLCFFGNLLRVRSGATLTLGTGTVLKNSASDFQFEAGATVNRTGAVFTSWRDDSLLGDTNADGDASAPADGDWTGIEVLDADGNSSYLPDDPTGDIRFSREG